MTPVFEGLKVVELASVLAGPAVGMFFAELGAEVIKVENKLTGGDVTRTWKTTGEERDSDASAYYWSINYGKKVQFLNLKDTQDYQVLVELIKDADIVISNFRGSVANRLKLDYSSIKSIDPTIIFAELTGYPKSDRPAYDVVLQAETGFMHMTGEPNRTPVKMPVALIDILAAHQLKEGVLVALIQQLKTGNGAHVQVNLFDTALASLANQATNWLIAKHIPKAMGSAHPNIAPYGDVFEGRDGKMFVLAVGSDKHFESLCTCIGLNELKLDHRFRTNADRVTHRMELIPLLAAEFAKDTAAKWVDQLTKRAVPCGLIRNMKEVFDLDIAKDMLLHYPDNPNRQTVRTAVFKITYP